MNRMRAADYLTMQAPAKPKRHKYGAVAAFRCKACGCEETEAVPCIACGSPDQIRFPSQAEARRYDHLMVEVRMGMVKNLRLQPRYTLLVNGRDCGTYVADAEYIRDGKVVVEDTKGVRTSLYILKRKLMKAIYGIDVVEVSA